MPRAGHHAEVIVAEDIAHVDTPMGLIGIRIRIARKENFVPEFEMKTIQKKEKSKKVKVEEVEVENVKVEVVKVEGKKDKARSESERIAEEAKKMAELESLDRNNFV